MTETEKATELSVLTVPKLKEALTKRGLPLGGRKADMVARLAAAMKEEPEQTAQQLDVTGTEVNTPKSGSAPSAAAKKGTTETQMESKSGSAGQKGSTATTEAERLKLRAERFGTPPSEEQKKAQRAERFGGAKTSQQEAPKVELHQKKLLDRASRFGLPVKGAPASKGITKSINRSWTPEEEEKKRKRLERFGSSEQKKQKV